MRGGSSIDTYVCMTDTECRSIFVLWTVVTMIRDLTVWRILHRVSNEGIQCCGHRKDTTKCMWVVFGFQNLWVAKTQPTICHCGPCDSPCWAMYSRWSLKPSKRPATTIMLQCMTWSNTCSTPIGITSCGSVLNQSCSHYGRSMPRSMPPLLHLALSS